MSRPLAQRLIIGLASVLLMLHGAGWLAAVIVFWQRATFHVPRTQSAIVLALAVAALRAASLPRRHRRFAVIGTLVIAAMAFVAAPLPHDFEGERLDIDAATSRALFEDRFRVARGSVSFHSHLADVLMTTLDRAFGRSEVSPSRAYDAMSRLAGLLFLIELGVVAACHRWSRQSCRYVGLAIATPLTLLYFGYWALGFLAMAAGVVPLLVLVRHRASVQSDASALGAGFLQGLHTALHGFGMLGLAGGALAALSGPGDAVRRLLRSATFTSAAVALYLGWVFLYVTVANLSITWSRELGSRPIFEPAVFANRIAEPLLSMAGLGEFGLFSALSGVPILAVAMLSPHRRGLLPAVLYAFPGLVFLVRWWPISAPFNLDLLLSVFPGLFAACWVVASTRRRSWVALACLAILHLVLWTTIAGGVVVRPWATGAP